MPINFLIQFCYLLVFKKDIEIKNDTKKLKEFESNVDYLGDL